MDKSNRILLGAFLILVIGFLVSYNGNIMTGSFSKDVTGMYTGDCADSDGGKVYDVKGTTGIQGQYWTERTDQCVKKTATGSWETVDSCYDDYCYLREYFCGTDNKVKIETKQCTGGYDCINGECVVGDGAPPAGINCRPDNCGDCSTKSSCIAQNDIPLSACEGKSKSECIGDCVWYTELESEGFGGIQVGGVVKDITGNPVVSVEPATGISPCRPKTNCVWLYDENAGNKGHCCGDKQFWNGVECESFTQTAGSLCFSFFPGNREEGKGAKYKEGKVCGNIGSSAYGFWTDIVKW